MVALGQTSHELLKEMLQQIEEARQQHFNLSEAVSETQALAQAAALE